MGIQESLNKIRAEWVERVSRDLARGEGVRAGFTEQLERFYEMLEQSVATGDPAWLDPILYDWGRASTETNLEKGDYDVSFLINRMIALTIEVVRENLGKKDAIEALGVIVPILSNSLSVVIRYEMEARVAHISGELGKVQEKLQELDRRKSNFISVAAHELKTPLTLIEGYTTMMMDIVDRSHRDPNMINMLKGIETGTHRLRRIIDDMIDVSLLDNNLLELNFQPVSVSHHRRRRLPGNLQRLGGRFLLTVLLSIRRARKAKRQQNQCKQDTLPHRGSDSILPESSLRPAQRPGGL
jgi:hypothetical protein